MRTTSEEKALYNTCYTLLYTVILMYSTDRDQVFMRTKQVNMRLDRDLIEAYEQMANKEDRDRTYFMRKALEAYMVKNPIKSPTPKNHTEDAVIDRLNKMAGTGYRYTENNRKIIRARLNDGFTVEDCFKVIEKKTLEWFGSDMAKYLRPETLFQASKFEGYLNQIVVKTKEQQREEDMQDWINGIEKPTFGEVIDHDPF